MIDVKAGAWAKLFLVGVAAAALTGCSSGTSDGKPVESPAETLSFFINVPEDFIALSHGGQLALKMNPPGIVSLKDTPVANMLALTTRLRDKDDRLVGITSELEDFGETKEKTAPDQAPDQAGTKVWDTYWTLAVAGRGSLYLHEKESLGPTVGRIFADAREQQKDWVGSHTEASTVGPLPGRNGEIVGGTGAFAGASGTFREIGTLKRFTRDGEIEARIELRLELDRAKK